MRSTQYQLSAGYHARCRGRTTDNVIRQTVESALAGGASQLLKGGKCQAPVWPRGELVESGQAKVGGGALGRTIHYLLSMARGQELRMGCPLSTLG